MKKNPSAPEAPATPASPAKIAVPPATGQAAQRPRVLHAVDRGTIAVAVVAVLLIAVLAYPRRPPTPAADEGAAAPAPAAVAESTVAPRANAASKKNLTPKPEKTRAAESSKSATPVAAVMPAADVTSTATSTPQPSGAEASVPSMAAAVPTGTADPSPITITGCLEVSVDNDEFRLTDTDGVDAPRSRSWKTGFLKKHSAPVALVEPPAQLALQTHVGRRVTATGLLSGHDLKVSALRAVGPSCE